MAAVCSCSSTVKTGEVKFINGSGVAPMAATVDFYKSKGGLPNDGVLSVSVPSAVAGAELAAKTYGTRPLGELLAPAVELAIVASRSPNRWRVPLRARARSWRRRHGKSRSRATARSRWATGGVQKDLAATPREIGVRGSGRLLRGPSRRELATYIKANGG